MIFQLVLEAKKSSYNWLVFVLFLPFDLIKAGATQTETPLLKQYVAGERVDLLDEPELFDLVNEEVFQRVSVTNWTGGSTAEDGSRSLRP